MARRARARSNILAQRRRQMRKDVKARVKTVRSQQVNQLLGEEKEPKSTTPMQSVETVLDLRARAKALGITGFSKMKKADLEAAIAAKEVE